MAGGGRGGETSQSGRRGVGTVNHCSTSHAIIEEVLTGVRSILTILSCCDARRAQGHHVTRSWRRSPGDAYRDPAGEAEAEDRRFSIMSARIPEDHHGRNRKAPEMLEGQNGAPTAVESRCCRCGGALLTQPVHAADLST